MHFFLNLQYLQCSYDEQLHRNVEKRENMSMNDSAHFSNTDSDFAENSE